MRTAESVDGFLMARAATEHLRKQGCRKSVAHRYLREMYQAVEHFGYHLRLPQYLLPQYLRRHLVKFVTESLRLSMRWRR